MFVKVKKSISNDSLIKNDKVINENQNKYNSVKTTSSIKVIRDDLSKSKLSK